MSTSLKERLSILNRPFTEIKIPSNNGESEEIGYYRRPTELEDSVLRKAMETEQKNFLAELKKPQEGSDKSVYDIVLEQFVDSKDNTPLDYVMSGQLMGIHNLTLVETGLKALDSDASEEDRKEFQEKYKPVFDRLLAEKREIMGGYDHEQLSIKAAQAFIENKAATHAIEVYRSQIIARSLYEKDEDNTGQFVLAYRDANNEPDPSQVPESLDSSTLTFIANKIVEEIEAAKTLPLKSAAKT